MNKLKMESLDMTKANIDKIAEMFPQVVTEMADPTGAVDENGNPLLKKAIDFEKLKLVLSAGTGDYVVVDDERERYEFTWVGKRQAMIDAATPIRKTLRPCPEESKDWATTENLYIEGDNLEVIKLLQESYLGKVKMIYIDPPYNTGKDFIYKDNFTQSREEYEEELDMFDEEGNRLFQNTETNGRFHSDWCSMIYPRLQLARNLLADDGVIFISIDDNEITNLRRICDEVFGGENFIGVIIQNKQNSKNDTLNIQKNHEYILAYRKSIIFDESGASIIATVFGTTQKLKDVFEENGEYYYINDQITTRGDGGVLSSRPNLGYTVYYNPKTKDKIAVCDYEISKAQTAKEYSELYTNRSDLIARGYVVIRPPKVRGHLGVWTWSLARFNENKKSIIITGKPGSYAVKKRTFVDKACLKTIDGKIQYFSLVESNVRSIWDCSTNEGTKILNDIMTYSCIFNNAKNLDMIKNLVKIVPFNDNDIIFDFFAGSATTAHAVMQLNAEDGGNRKFIMVQLPELCDPNSEAAKAGYKTICEIGKERIRRAGAKIIEGLKAKNEGLFAEDAKPLDTGFRVFKLDTTNMKDVYYGAGQLSQKDLWDTVSNIKDDRSDIDLLYGCLLDWGVQLTMPHTTELIESFTVHTVDSPLTDEIDLIACFDSEVSETVVRTIAKRKPTRALFRDSSFADSANKINVFEIFKSICNWSDEEVKKNIKVI